MKNFKKVLSLVMAAAMMLSLMVFGTSAAFSDQSTIENTTAVDMCAALNIINGYEDGSFGPTDTVTRAQMAKMICVALNGGNAPTLGTKSTPTFSDIGGNWAEAYIEYCASLGIVAGVGDGSFQPNATVTGTQAAKMLLVALGYSADAEGFNGSSWSVKINVVASQKDLYKDLSIDPNAALSRDDAAQMIWNTLNATMVKYVYSLTTNDGILTNIQVAEEYSDARTLLSNKYSEADFDGQLTKFSYNSSKEEWTYTVVDSSTAKTFTCATDYTGLYGQNVNVVYKVKDNKVDTVFGMYSDDCSVLFSGVAGDLTVKTDTVKLSGVSYDLNGTSATTKAYDFAYNTDFTTASGTALNALSSTQKTYAFDAVDTDNDGDVDFLVLYPFTVQKVTYVGSKTITAGASYTIEDCSVYTGIAKNDYTKITAAANTATNTTTLAAVDKTVNGKVTAISGSTYYINGTGYSLASGVTAGIGDTVKDAPVVNGYLFAADTSGTTQVEDYAIVVSAAAASGVTGDQAKLLFSDGTKKIVDTDQSYNSAAYLGQLVTYTINSDNEYELTAVGYTALGSGFDQAIGSTGTVTNKDSGTTSGKVKYINGWNIADDAVIFVKNTSDGSYSVISGSKLLTASVSGLTLAGAFADDNATSGYSTVQLAYISSTAALTTADVQYGYALDDYSLVKNSDDQTVYQYSLWNGTNEITVQTKNNTLTNGDKVTKGSVVKYTVNSDGAIDALTVYTTDATATQAAAITAYDGTYLQLNGAATRYEITDDTVILYVDNSDVDGIAGGSIQLASDAPSSYAGYATYGHCYANAIAVTNSSDEVELLMVDVNNDILNVQ